MIVLLEKLHFNTMKRQSIYLYTDISGNKVTAKKYTFGQGAKRLAIVGGVHGGEVTYFIFHKLATWLKNNEEKLDFQVILIPISNPVSWQQRIYYYTVGKFSMYKGKDFNRSYDDKNHTLSSLISSKVWKEIEDYEIVIDLHTARSSIPYIITMDEVSLQLAKSISIPYVYFLNLSSVNIDEYKYSLLYSATKKGKKSVVIECGSHDAYEENNITLISHELINLITGKLVNNIQQTTLEKNTTLYSTMSGFIVYKKNPGQSFSKHETMYEIYSSNNVLSVQTIQAKNSGIVMEIAKTNIVWTGDEVMKVIYK